MAELLLDTDLTAEQREDLNMLKMSADSLLAIINDILEYSKIGAGKLDMEPIEFKLVTLCTLLPRPSSLRPVRKILNFTAKSRGRHPMPSSATRFGCGRFSSTWLGTPLSLLHTAKWPLESLSNHPPLNKMSNCASRYAILGSVFH